MGNGAIKLYLVGGAVRNHIMGEPVGDLDFAVEADNYENMRDYVLNDLGGYIWQEKPHFVSLRCRVPSRSLPLFGGIHTYGYLSVNADFTLCRQESHYSDGRHPDTVTPADIYRDLARRDFTMNAIAVAEDETVIDPYNGRQAIASRTLDTVGEPDERFAEDPLRILRGIRFISTLGVHPTSRVMESFSSPCVWGIRNLPRERITNELTPASRRASKNLLQTLFTDFPMVGAEVLNRGIWFKPTTESR